MRPRKTSSTRCSLFAGNICAKCGEIIASGTIITALEKKKKFHKDCFCCALCDKPFGEEKYLEEDDKPYHVSCKRGVCALWLRSLWFPLFQPPQAAHQWAGARGSCQFGQVLPSPLPLRSYAACAGDHRRKWEGKKKGQR